MGRELRPGVADARVIRGAEVGPLSSFIESETAS